MGVGARQFLFNLSTNWDLFFFFFCFLKLFYTFICLQPQKMPLSYSKTPSPAQVFKEFLHQNCTNLQNALHLTLALATLQQQQKYTSSGQIQLHHSIYALLLCQCVALPSLKYQLWSVPEQCISKVEVEKSNDATATDQRKYISCLK